MVNSARHVCVIMASSRVGNSTIHALHREFRDRVRIRAVFRSHAKLESSDMPDGVAAVLWQGPPSDSSSVFLGVDSAFIIAPQTQNRDAIVNEMMSVGRSHGLRHVVLIGGVFQEEEKFLYHKQWMSTRRHAQRLGLGWTQLECPDFMENVFRNQSSIKQDGSFAVVGEEGCSPPVTLDDVARAAAAVLSCDDDRHWNRAYRVTGSQLLTPGNIVATISDVLKKPIQKISKTVEEYRKEAEESGVLPAWQATGFSDWLELYFITGRFKDVKSDLPLLGIEPTTFRNWFEIQSNHFKQ